MKSYADKVTRDASMSNMRSNLNQQSGPASSSQYIDRRAATITQRKLAKAINASTKQAVQRVGNEEELLQGKFETIQRVEEDELLQGKFDTVQRVEEEEMMQGKFESLQKKENKTGLPNDLKSGMEGLSGRSLDHVKVHYNSPKPASVQAHAYAQGSDIHLASGQEKHLPHELGHVVQQMEGRVQPTTNVAGSAVNDNPGLENEATVMGARALQRAVRADVTPEKKISGKSLHQFVVQLQMDAGDGAEWHIHHDHMKLGNLVKSRIEFNGRSAKDIRKELGEKIERHGLSVGGDQAKTFRECIDYINANY